MRWLYLAGLLALAPGALRILGEEPAHADKVKVEIIEGLPDETSWNFTPGPAAETFYEPAFGFPVLPTKYSEKGIKVDRAMPILVRASGQVQLPPGKHELLLRARTGARVYLDGKLIASTPFPDLKADGHEEVPATPLELGPDVRLAPAGHTDALVTVEGDGLKHQFQLEALVGIKQRRPELGELSLSIASEKGYFRLLSPTVNLPLTDEAWGQYESERRAFWKTADIERRKVAAKAEADYWQKRHDLAREIARKKPTLAVPSIPADYPALNDVDRFLAPRLLEKNRRPAALLDDHAFLRRLALDTIGAIPSLDQTERFLKDAANDRRAAAVERFLAHPGWADHWVGYWQDVLAENPGILKPMLNNTGPFRYWIHESFFDNKPMDRFVTELVMMEGSVYYGGPGGFGMATENDVPMAAKAQIIAQGFMAMQLQCARCHDAPYHHFKQQDLFSMAAMLKKAPQPVPASSSIPTNANIVLGRLVNVTLPPGSKVEPHWPFAEVIADEPLPGVLRQANDSRERLAALLTDPRNERFAQVLANRLWKRYLGWGIVEPVDDWETAKPSHPELLEYLGRELITRNYDLKHLARLILNSRAYQTAPTAEGSQEKPATERLFASPARRRMSAEQLVDSLFQTAGKDFRAEEMNLDVDGRRPVKDFNNLGRPQRAWEFTSLSNERDRPALAMPRAQQIVDVLTTFGWRESRQSPQTVRDDSPNIVQPASLANGVLTLGRAGRLSDDHEVTALALETQPLEELTRRLYLKILTRPPTAAESRRVTEYLRDGYETRVTDPRAASKKIKRARAVSWSNHLNPEATRIKHELEKEAREGDSPTQKLAGPWRERLEDVLWAMLNSPEFIFIP